MNKAGKIIIGMSIIVFFIGCGTKSTHGKHDLGKIENMEDLFLLGYNHMNDSCFPLICEALMDSIVKSNYDMQFVGGTSINEIDSVVDWFISGFVQSEGMNIHDIFFCFFDLEKESILKLGNDSLFLSDIQSSVTECVFYPDTTQHLEYRSVSIPEIGDFKRPIRQVVLQVNFKQNSFSVNDWCFFFQCVHEIIVAFDKERRKMSLKIWNKSYDSLSFDEKKYLWDIVYCPLRIEFYEKQSITSEFYEKGITWETYWANE